MVNRLSQRTMSTMVKGLLEQAEQYSKHQTELEELIASYDDKPDLEEEMNEKADAFKLAHNIKDAAELSHYLAGAAAMARMLGYLEFSKLIDRAADDV